jgi:regulator of sigma E protease
LFAWLLISIGFMTGLPTAVTEGNIKEVRNAHLTITNVQVGTPAAKADLSAGDKILSIKDSHDHELAESGASLTPEQLRQFIATYPGELTVHFLRGKEMRDVKATPLAGIVEGRPALGISMDIVGTLKLSVFKAFYEGAKLTADLTKAVALGLGQFIYQAFTGQAKFSEVSGPVGIAGLVGSASKLGFVYLLSFTAFISINLAVLNLIPFPALDGGRILFVIIESIRRKNINPKIANTVNTIGFVLLITLMLVVTYKDIVKLF